jgi:N-acetylmuramoyl-L-alanine amidase
LKKNLLLAALLFIMALGAAEEGSAGPRLLKVRKWSAPDHTRVVLDLEGSPAYEVEAFPHSPILTIRFPKLALPQGAGDVIIKDEMIHKAKLLPEKGEGAKITFFLVQPTQCRVFALAKPDRLVIDIFRPGIEPGAKEEKLARQETKDQPTLPDKKEEPSGTAPEHPPKNEEPPRKMERPSQSVGPEGPREKEAPPSKGAAKLLEIRQWSAPDHTRVVVDLDGAPAYEALPSTDSLTYTLILRGVLLPKGGQEVPVADQVIQKLRLEPEGKEEARLTLFLVKPGGMNIFLLKPYLDKPDRLVIDISRPDLVEKEKEQRQVTRELKAKKKRIVVLDPGHGGEDPGAIGPRGTMEKDIVLSLAKSLQKALDATGEVRAFLTRRGDYFVSLQDRVKIAQEYGADLFVSLHANGSKSRQTRGTSIYCLSLKGASDTATQVLAQKENASDLMGGISQASARRDLNSILLDLEQTHSINESLQLGGLALSELGRVNQIQFSQPRQAGFAVLKAHEFPSILVETAYLTHPGEESLLRKRNFQEKLCQAISAAILRFIPRFAVKEERPTERGEKKPSDKKGI